MNHLPYSSAVVAAALSSAAAGQPCVPGWHSVAPGLNNGVLDMCIYAENGRPTLFAGGTFSMAGGIVTGSLARWDGIAWSAVGDSDFHGTVYTMTVFDDGAGPALYVGGSALRLGTALNEQGVFRWDGIQWTRAGGVLNGRVWDLVEHDDGTEPALYAGGNYWSPLYGQSGPRSIMKLAGQDWVPVGGGTNGEVLSLLSFDDGTGQALYVSGAFLSPSAYTVRWDGTQWHDMRGNCDSVGGRMLTYDSGSGESIYLTGLRRQNGVLHEGLFRWTGSDWEAIGITNTDPKCATVWDDGAGPALYIGGDFQNLNGTPMKYVARWDGSSWSDTGADVLTPGGAGALLPHDDGYGPSLFAGGFFNQHQPTRFMVRYTTCNHPGPCYPNCDGSTVEPVLNVDDFMCFINEFASGHSLPHAQQVEHYANCDGSTAAPVLNVDDFACFINAYAGGCR